MGESATTAPLRLTRTLLDADGALLFRRDAAGQVALVAADPPQLPSHPFALSTEAAWPHLNAVLLLNDAELQRSPVVAVSAPRHGTALAVATAISAPDANDASPTDVAGDVELALYLLWDASRVPPRVVLERPDSLRGVLHEQLHRLHREADLHLGRARLEVLLTALPHGLILTDEARGTAVVNAAAAALLECPAGLLPASVLADAMQTLHTRLSNASQVRLEGRDLFLSHDATRINWVWEVVRPSRRVLLVSTLPVHTTMTKGRLWSFHDVSALREAEAEQSRLLRQLDRERERLGELLTHTPAMILLVRGPDHVVEFANDAVALITGGRSIVGQRLFEDVNRAMIGSDIHAAYDQAFHTGTPWNGSAVRVALAKSSRTRGGDDTSDGDFFYNISLQPLRDGDGAVSGLFVHSVDVTTQVQAVEQLRQSQRLETMGRLTGGVAHDFNNLLTVISGSTDLLLAELAPSSRAHASATDVHHAVRRAASLTRQLLNFGRRHVLQQHVVCLDEVVRGIERMVKRLIGDRISIEFALEAGNATLVADPSHLEQVLLNLAANARDAMPDGGKLVIRTQVAVARAAETDANRLLRGPHLRIEVQDNGEGMSPETIAQAFEPFFTTKPPDKGTGLGLSTVRAIIEETGGELWIESEVGRGTTMIITLPLAAGPATLLEEAPTAAPLQRGGTVLLVEDDSIVAMVTQRILEEGNYRILIAKSGAEGLRLWQNHLLQHSQGGGSANTPGWQIDLVITDLTMPEVNGRDMVRQMRAVAPNLPVLFTSGDLGSMLEAEDLRGPTAFLPKPFTAELLLREVAALLPGG